MPKAPNPCHDCADALELDQIAIVKADLLVVEQGPAANLAEIGVIACDRHLRRYVLAMELLAAFETRLQGEVPPLAELVYQDSVIVEPERRPRP